MKRQTISIPALAFSVLLAGDLTAETVTWHVDKATGDDMAAAADATGLTSFRTIQGAVDRAGSGDTILVAPGVYDEGGYGAKYDGVVSSNRVYISKALHLKGTGGAGKTHIVGLRDTVTPTAEMGCGPLHMRCVYATGDAAGTVIEGFTLRDGASGNDKAIDNVPQRGGGLAVTSARKDVYLLDCVVSNCVAVYGGAMHGGTAVRSLIAYNGAINIWGIRAGIRMANAYSSLIVRNDGSPCFESCTMVNCTVAENGGDPQGKFYNCLVSRNALAHSGTFVDSLSDDTAIFSPLTMDYRLTSGNAAVTTGRSENLTQVALPSGYGCEGKDFNGNAFAVEDGVMAAGAVGSAGVPACGSIYFADKCSQGGHATVGASYANFDVWPTQICIRPVVATGKTFFRYAVTGANALYDAQSRFAQMDGTVWFVPPFQIGSCMTNVTEAAGRILWADANSSGTSADGSEDKPFSTLQAAVDYAVQNGKSTRTVILAREGDYKTGGKTGAYKHLNRLYIPADCYILVRGVDGAEKTVLRGQAASLEKQQYPDQYPGCGPDAVRCLCVESVGTCAMQGFTLADGFSDAADSAQDTMWNRAGGILASGSRASFQFLDGVITNCFGIRYGAMLSTWFARGRMRGCRASGGVVRSSILSAVDIDDSNTASTDVIGSNAIVVHLTGGRYDDTAYPISGDCVASVMVKMNCQANRGQYGTIVKQSDYVSTSAQEAVVADPLYADLEGGDWRVRVGSPAFGGGNFTNDGKTKYTRSMEEYGCFATTGIGGRPILFFNGVPTAGAYQEAVRSCVIAGNREGLAINGEQAAASTACGRPFDVGITQGSRPVVGFVIAGKEYSFADQLKYSFDPDDFPEFENIALAVNYSTNWYVNPAATDAGTGFVENDPKKTLKGVMTLAASGDVVHAARGTYDEGRMYRPGASETDSLASRVVIKSGVTLVSDEGADRTFIVGEGAATDPDRDQWGRGTDAVRCAFVCDNARIRGFTLTGGRTFYKQQQLWDSDHGGAGVCGTENGRGRAWVEDCVISNNVAYNSGGALYVSMIKCRLTENSADVGGASRLVDMYGCLVDRNASGAKSAANVDFSRFYQTTIGPDNRVFGGSGTTLALDSGSSSIARLCNCLILGRCGAKGGMTVAASNSVFIAGNEGDFTLSETCKSVPETEVVVDDDLRPVVGSNVAVDMADRQYFLNLDETTDVSGFQRIMNARMDVGALEGDWRARFSADIGNGSVKVYAASPEVEETAGRSLRMTSGGLSFEWKGREGQEVGYSVFFRVNEGTATATVNGEKTVFSASDSVQELKFASALALNDIRIDVNGDAGDVEILKARKDVGLAIIVR